MSGAGNLFSVIDNRKYKFDINTLKQLSPILCSKNEYNNFISEGFIAIEDSDSYDFTAKFFNPDGSFGAMCGNGGRCAVHFAFHNKFFTNNANILFDMADNIYEAKIERDGNITLKFPPPVEIVLNKIIEIDTLNFNLTYIDVGSPHAVINYSELNLNMPFREFDISKYGKSIRYHNEFQPSGVNANFYLIDKNCIQLRTYERGVEAETGACGTGAISTAIAGHFLHGLPFPITIIPPSRQPLSVNCTLVGNTITNLFLCGPTDILNKTTIDIPKFFLEASND